MPLVPTDQQVGCHWEGGKGVSDLDLYMMPLVTTDQLVGIRWAHLERTLLGLGGGRLWAREMGNSGLCSPENCFPDPEARPAEPNPEPPTTPAPLPAYLQGNRQNYSALDITNPSIRCDFLGLTTLPGTPGPASCPAVIPPLVPPPPPPPLGSPPPPPPCDKTDKYSKVKDDIHHATSTVASGINDGASTVIEGVSTAASAVGNAASTVGSAVSGFVDAHTRKVLCEPGDAGCGKLARRMAARLPTDRITVLEVKDLLEE